MKRYTIWVFILLVFIMLGGCSSKKSENTINTINKGDKKIIATESEKNTIKNYVGIMGNSMVIHMNLNLQGEKIFGTYYYDKYKKEISLKGVIDQKKNISIDEIDNKGVTTARFKGTFITNKQIKGTWSSQDKLKNLPFIAEELVKGQDSKQVLEKIRPWYGEWNRTNDLDYEDSWVKISNVKENSFYFEIEALSDAHQGFLEGTAKADGNNAIYYGEDEVCEGNKSFVKFSIKDETLIITTQENGPSSPGAGWGVFYDGTYKKGKQPKVEKTKLDFLDEEQNKEFKNLVGDEYDGFISYFHVIYELNDLDGFNANVYRGGVRGVFGQMEGIIMINEKGNIWAALPYGEDSIAYYTNDIKYSSKLPKTILKWAEGLNCDKNYKVAYKYKPQLGR